MMFYISEETRYRMNAIAAKAGTFIPGEIEVLAWTLPILEKLLDRIQELENKIDAATKTS